MNPNVRSKVANQSVRDSAQLPQFLHGSPGSLNPHLCWSFHWLWNNSIWISWIQKRSGRVFKDCRTHNLSLKEFCWKTKCKTIFHLINSLLKSEHDGCGANKATGMCVSVCVFVRVKDAKTNSLYSGAHRHGVRGLNGCSRYFPVCYDSPDRACGPHSLLWHLRAPAFTAFGCYGNFPWSRAWTVSSSNGSAWAQLVRKAWGNNIIILMNTSLLCQNNNTPLTYIYKEFNGRVAQCLLCPGPNYKVWWGVILIFFQFLSPSSLPSLVTITQVPAIVNLIFYDSFITKASRSWWSDSTNGFRSQNNCPMFHSYYHFHLA